MNRSRKLIVVLIVFLAGIYFAEEVAGVFGDVLNLVYVSGVFFVFGVVINRKFVLIGIFFVGVIYFQLSWPKIDENFIAFYNDLGDLLEFKGIISEEVDIRADQIKVTLDVYEVEVGGVWKDVEGKVLVKLHRYPEFDYGDELVVRGFLQTPAEFDTFSYKNYLARYGVYSVAYNPFVELLSKNKGRTFFAAIFKFKKKIEGVINKIFPEPQASFAAGLLLGSRRGIPEHLMKDFNTTGLTHIIAISGYNITLIIILISGLLKNFSRKLKVIVASGIIVVFTILVGASAAVVRASIMGILTLIALWFGRKSQVSIALVLTAAVMTLWNPKILVYDVGFQLSFAATCGLVYVSDYLERFFKWAPESLGIRESLLLTISAQVFALPIILNNFERFSIVSPLANLLVAPFIPLSMLFGAIAVVVFPIIKIGGLLIGFFAWLFLKIIIIFTHLTAKIPYASLEISWFSEVFFYLYYIVIICVFRIRKPK